MYKITFWTVIFFSDFVQPLNRYFYLENGRITS